LIFYHNFGKCRPIFKSKVFLNTVYIILYIQGDNITHVGLQDSIAECNCIMALWDGFLWTDEYEKTEQKNHCFRHCDNYIGLGLHHKVFFNNFSDFYCANKHIKQLEKAITNKSAKIHAGTVFCTSW